MKRLAPIAVVCAFALAAAMVVHGNASEQKKVGFAIPGYSVNDSMADALRQGRLWADLVLSAPPRETSEESQAIYGPVAEYLTQALGRKVVFAPPGTWGVFQAGIKRGDYDIVYLGPHLAGWLVTRHDYEVVAKGPGEISFVVFVQKKAARYQSIKDLAGRRVCTHAQPNLATLVVLGEFTNPARQPVVAPLGKDWKQFHDAVVDGRCDAGVMPVEAYRKLGKDGKTRIVHQSKALPNLAFVASRRVDAVLRQRMKEALLSPASPHALERLLASSGIKERFVHTADHEYAVHAALLKDEWGW